LWQREAKSQVPIKADIATLCGQFRYQGMVWKDISASGRRAHFGAMQQARLRAWQTNASIGGQFLCGV
jgi:hypothetical protein